MSSVKKAQEEAIASINTAKALVDKVLAILELVLVNPSLPLVLPDNPIEFLLEILKTTDATREEVEKWIANFIVWVIPSLEISVKSILLTNLKNMISCSVDPRIPDKYRKRHVEPINYNTRQEYGIDINIESIDFMDKLSINPLGKFGSGWYFGLEGVEDSYKFARADDMDAFLWFVIHKGKFPNSSKISNISGTEFANEIHGEHAKSVTPSDGTLLTPLEVEYNNDDASSILLGNTFTYDKSSHVISMCIDKKYDDADNIVHNTLVPVSDDWSSVNWYARRADQLGKNLGFGWGINQNNGNSYYKGKMSLRNKSIQGRDFTKERAICNIQYIDQASSDAPITGLVNNKFRFTILPKPLIHIPNLAMGEAPWAFKKMLFDEKGNYDANGKYTLVDITDSKDLRYLNGNVTIDPRSGNVTVNDKDEVVRNLVECYPGLTVFEFNYDYIMSIKLFDAKVMAHSLIETVLDVRMGLNDKRIQPIHQEATETIKQIIKNIVESDESETNNCYYTFDSTKYDLLLKKAEEKRARQHEFGNATHEVGLFDSVNDILNEYDANANPIEQEKVIHRAITQAALTVSSSLDEADRYSVEFDFVFDIIEALTTAIVNGILSPKVLMLLEVNQKIMGGTWEKFTMKDLLQALQSTIIAIVKEIRDLVGQELHKLVTSKLEPLLQTITPIIFREQLENYSEAVLDIIRNCPPILLNLGFQYQETKLDTVDYADIDTTVTNKEAQPSTNKC